MILYTANVIRDGVNDQHKTKVMNATEITGEDHLHFTYELCTLCTVHTIVKNSFDFNTYFAAIDS